MRIYEPLLILLALSLFSIYKKLSKYILILTPLTLLIYWMFAMPLRSEIVTGPFGISLSFTPESRLFLLAAASGFSIVAIHLLGKNLSKVFSFSFTTSLITLSFLFLSKDLFNIYVLMEVLSVQAAIMILEKLDERKLWASLKYLIIGNVGANVYLVGAVLYYIKTQTFQVTPNADAPNVATALMLTGLLIRTGVFGFGMWLPQFHSAAEKELSALLSGVFVNGGIYALFQISNLDFPQMWRYLAPFLAIVPAVMCILSRNPKRTLAWSTMAHLTFLSGFPTASPIYALSHGLSKTLLFLKSDQMKDNERDLSTFLLILIATLSLAGMPMTIGAFSEHILLENTQHLGKLLILLSIWISSGGIMKHILRGKSRLGFHYSAFLIPIFLFPKFSIAGLIGISVALLLGVIHTKKDVYLKIERLEENLLIISGALAVMIWLF